MFQRAIKQTCFPKEHERESYVMKRFVVTGAPGAGKTAIIRQLELDGVSVVEEAATDVIAAAQAGGIPEPWTRPSFIDSIVALQKQRQIRASCLRDEMQLYDRSPICTAALSVYLGYSFSAALTQELQRIKAEAIYEQRVFFIRHLGFMRPTEARKISFQEALRFERIHEEVYQNFGFELIPVGPGNLADRCTAIKSSLSMPDLPRSC